MNLNYILKRKKIFTKRSLRINYTSIKLRLGSSGLVSLKKQRFELVYLRFLKKLVRRKHMRKKMIFRRRKFWLFLKPNMFLSGKTTNSRMGAGVGSFVRLAIQLIKYQSFIEFQYFSSQHLKLYNSKLRYKYPLVFKLYVDIAVRTKYK